MCTYVYAYMYAICMRQRGHFHSFTLKAARRHLGMSATTVCRTVRAFEFVRVCSSLLEFAFEFVLSWAVRVLRNRVNRVSRCASRCVSHCASPLWRMLQRRSSP